MRHDRSTSTSPPLATSALVPDDREDVDMLLDVFVLEKALYEVRYELGQPARLGALAAAAVAELIDPMADASAQHDPLPPARSDSR